MAQPKTIIGIPTKANDRAHVDAIISHIRRNVAGLDREHFRIVVDANGMDADLNAYFDTQLWPLKKQADLTFCPHEEAGRIGALNRIAHMALDDPQVKSVIYMNDDILLGKDTLNNLAAALDKHAIAGALVRPLDTRGKNDTSLSQMAQLDFEYRLRKKKPHLHGALFGIAKSELLDMQKEGFFPPVHFDDDYLTVRHKLKHGMDKDIPILEECPAFSALPATWPEAVGKVARYNSGDKQLAHYFEGIGQQSVAQTLRSMSNSSAKATAQFTLAFSHAEKIAASEPIAAMSVDVDYLMDIWRKMIPDAAKEQLPTHEKLRDTLERLVVWDERKEGYTVRSPEVTLPLINSIVNLLGIHKAESGYGLNGTTWARDGQSDIAEKPLGVRPPRESRIKSAVPEPAKRIGVAY